MIMPTFTALCDGVGCESEEYLGAQPNKRVARAEAVGRGWRLATHHALCPACVARGNQPANAAEAERRLYKAGGE